MPTADPTPPATPVVNIPAGDVHPVPQPEDEPVSDDGVVRELGQTAQVAFSPAPDTVASPATLASGSSAGAVASGARQTPPNLANGQGVGNGGQSGVYASTPVRAQSGGFMPGSSQTGGMPGFTGFQQQQQLDPRFQQQYQAGLAGQSMMGMSTPYQNQGMFQSPGGPIMGGQGNMMNQVQQRGQLFQQQQIASMFQAQQSQQQQFQASMKSDQESMMKMFQGQFAQIKEAQESLTTDAVDHLGGIFQSSEAKVGRVYSSW